MGHGSLDVLDARIGGIFLGCGIIVVKIWRPMGGQKSVILEMVLAYNVFSGLDIVGFGER